MPAIAASAPTRPGPSSPRPTLRGRATRRSVDPAELRAEADVIDARVRRNASAERKKTVALAYDLAEMDEDRRWAAYDFGSLAEYARDRRVAYSASQIRQLVALVRSLERLPLSKREFLKGDLPWTWFREHARYATPENEAALLADMRTMTGPRFLERLRRLRGAPVRRKVTIEVTLEEHDHVQAAIAAARADDRTLTLGQAVARICASYVQEGERGGARAEAPPTAPVVSPAPPEAVTSQDAPPPAPETKEDEAVDRQHVPARTLSCDDQEAPRVNESRRAARDGRLVLELDRRGLSVRRVDGTVLGTLSFEPSASPRPGLLVATPEVTTATDARIRAG